MATFLNCKSPEEEQEAVQTLLSAIVGDPVITSATLSPLSHQPAVLDLLENLIEQGLLYGFYG
jgi:hydroxymethylpyrimidine/phosphomethylpyrimidine kinase